MRSCFYIFPGIFPAVLTAYFHQIRQKHFCLFPWLYTKRYPLSDTGRQKQRRRQIHRTPSRYCRISSVLLCRALVYRLQICRLHQGIFHTGDITHQHRKFIAADTAQQIRAAELRSRLAVSSHSTVSPKACPLLSLTFLKSSISIIATPNGLFPSFAAA